MQTVVAIIGGLSLLLLFYFGYVLLKGDQNR